MNECHCPIVRGVCGTGDIGVAIFVKLDLPRQDVEPKRQAGSRTCSILDTSHEHWFISCRKWGASERY